MGKSLFYVSTFYSSMRHNNNGQFFFLTNCKHILDLIISLHLSVRPSMFCQLKLVVQTEHVFPGVVNC